MNSWKTKLIDCYRVSTSPYRAWRRWRMKSTGTMPVFSIFYHRIADDSPNPWSMTKDQFKQQIDWFQKEFDLVSLAELQRRIDSGFNDRPTLAITFDDGYAENNEFALPLLIERDIPVCYFITIENIISQTAFPHDVALGQELAVNSAESIRMLSNAGVEIGAHTRTHLDLGKVTDLQLQMDELIHASREIEKLIDKPVQYFAFPFGQKENLSHSAFGLLKEHGFVGVCSAYGGWNNIGGDSFHIQRIHGDPSFERMRNWLSFDPRIAYVEPYKYERRSVDRMPYPQLASMESLPAIPVEPLEEANASTPLSTTTTPKL